jgi:hypothetical protein
VGYFYEHKGSYPAAANRLQALSDQFPLYSQTDEALWLEGDAYQRMGDNFENQQAAAYAKIVRQYPLSPHAEEAKSRLKAMNRPVPEVDPVAYSHMKYEQENRSKRGLMGTLWGPFASHPNMTPAAKSGTPMMEGLHPTIPASVPIVAAGTSGTSANPGTGVGGAGSDVTATTVTDTSLIDKAPNVLPGAAAAPGEATATPAAAGTPPRGGTPASGTPAAGAAPTVSVGGAQTPVTPQAQPNPNAPLPQNHTGKIKKLSPSQQLKETQRQQELFKKMQKKQAEQQKKAQEAQAKLDKKAAAQKKKADPQQSQQPPATPPAQPAVKQ